MIQVRILDQCEFCDGEAYIFVCEDVDSRGDTFDRYKPCEMCRMINTWLIAGGME